MSRLAGSVAVVTGAARRRGIGRGIATCLAEEGCDVAVNDVAASAEGQELVDELVALGRRAIWCQADVSDPEQVRAMFDRVETELGAASVICSNAGVARWSDVVDMSDEDWNAIIAVNVIGAFNVIGEGARRLVAKGLPGRVIVTSSVHVQMPFAGMSAYGASKAALNSLVEVAALEWAAHGITVNHIGPGYVESAINDASPALRTPEDVAATRASIPVGRSADPRELGRAAVFLASEDASYITGEYLRVDGGLVVGQYT